jgi:hypothetical protein
MQSQKIPTPAAMGGTGPNRVRPAPDLRIAGVTIRIKPALPRPGSPTGFLFPAP